MIARVGEPRLVSVIIQNYNGKEYLKKWLKSVLNLGYPNFEVIIMDDWLDLIRFLQHLLSLKKSIACVNEELRQCEPLQVRV
jgi:cellulose synthase/poly-beta-1,6-N-acetylglucosamine synthase-like glycosyltransferase